MSAPTAPPPVPSDPAEVSWLLLTGNADRSVRVRLAASAAPVPAEAEPLPAAPAPEAAPGAGAGAGAAQDTAEQAGQAEPVTLSEPALAPLRANRDFRMLWGGAGLSVLASRATAVAYPLTVLWATRSPGAAGLVGAALLLPQLLVQLPGGALVDRWDRRRLMVCSGLGQAVAAGAVAAMLATHHFWLWAMLLSAFVEGALAVLHQLAERAAVPSVVPPSQLGTALGGNEARTRAASIAGQPLGSGLLAVAQSLPYVAAVAAQLASVLCLLGVRGDLQEQRPGPRPGLVAEVREGLVWMWRQPLLRAVMAAVAVTNVLFQALNLAVMDGIRQAGGSPFQAGLVLSLSGVGGLLGALTGGWWNRRFSLRALVRGGLLVWSLLLPPVAFLHGAGALGPLFAASGFVGGVFNVAGGVYLVSIAPDAMRGRANSVAMLVGSGAMAAGPVAAGVALGHWGPGPVILSLATAMAVTTLTTLLSPSFRRSA
ncbi:MFS family permease [Streptacidiphilus sp. MAP12-33]|uniref:MFS transporter n=1 Tax=Streptacidiphilus sp. MAP12-33 TaxID=3156266 RepID=UPI0035127EED